MFNGTLDVKQSSDKVREHEYWKHCGNLGNLIECSCVAGIGRRRHHRYRSNPPISVIEAEAPDVDLSWFKGLKKEKANIGFGTYSPNFYYQNNSVASVFTADLDKLRALMPAGILARVQPLQV